MTDIILNADDKTAAALVATIRAAVNGDGKYRAYAAAHNVTRDNVADHARALAVLTYPNDAPVQKKDGKRTRFGNAVQKAGAGLRSTFETEESDSTPDYLALAVQAARTAYVKGEVTPKDIMLAVESALGQAATA